MTYNKMSGKVMPHQPLWINKTMVRELTWIADRVEMSDGIHMMDSHAWGADDASMTIYTDACPSGLGFWCKEDTTGYLHIIRDTSPIHIFYLEALTVLSAIHHVASAYRPPPARLAIFTDNTNTIDIFNSLRATPEYNPLLLSAMTIALDFPLTFRVFHIPGDDNTVADALSRGNTALALALVPNLHLSTFQPPHVTLGAAKK